MSNILEKKGKGKLDDTIPLKCSIESFVNVDDHTEFIIQVQRGANIDNSWKVQHRYNHFVTLHSSLTLNANGTDLVLPPKKKFGNKDSIFIHERRVALQEFMNNLLSSAFSQHIAVKKFLDPDNYSDEIDRVAQQQAAMFFRSEPRWELQEKLKDIGWRLRKNFFIVKSKDNTQKNKFLLSWVEHGPDMNLDHETTLLALLQCLLSLKHPFIYPVNYASCTDKGSTVVRCLHPPGSLRDLIFKTKPTLPYVKKYGMLKGRVGLEISHVQRIGRQVLEALKFLRDAGWPYGHLHAGNVIVDEQQTRLLDIENGILGLSSAYRSYMMELKCIKNLESMDVYCFGHLLYEMTFGASLQNATIINLPESCPPILKPILLSILSTKSSKMVLPTIDDLIALPFFNEVVVEASKPSFKLGKLKDSLKQVQNCIESRLRDDQRKLRQFHRLTKARSEILSEEEKKKRKKSSNKKVSVSAGAAPATQQNGVNNSVAAPCVNQPTKTSQPAVLPVVSGLPPPPPPLAPQLALSAVKGPSSLNPSESTGRSALLSSISSFGKGNLKKCQTNDRSSPKI